MKKIFAFVIASLLMMACSYKTTVSTHSLLWIQDKPGQTLHSHDIFPTVPDSLWEALGLQEGVPSSMSCMLLGVDDEKILVDAGLGAPFSMLMQTLKIQGVTCDNLKLIYITHMHADHIGGLLKEGKAVFPNAEVYINRVEVEAWKAMDAAKNAQQMQVLEAYKDHLHLFEAGDVLPGDVKSIAAYGHTPGHTIFQKDELLIIGDLIHGAALQLEHPEYCPFFDMDPEAATEARIRILKYARENNLKMYGMHIPAPGSIN